MTGSQSFALMHGVSQTLSGRVAVLSLDPLSLAETLERPTVLRLEALLARVFDGQTAHSPAATEPPVDFGDGLLRGGFPEPRVNREVDRQLWFASYVQTHLERDVRDLAQVADNVYPVCDAWRHHGTEKSGRIIGTSCKSPRR
jgi:predicted AAA+ superfamily ATPase